MERGSTSSVDGGFLGQLQDHWLFNFLLNLAGYGVIVVPAALLIRWLRSWPPLHTGSS